MEIEFWERSDGIKPVVEFIKELNEGNRILLLNKFERYEKYSFQYLLSNKRIKEFKHIKVDYEFSLYELRVFPYRFFFVMIVPGEILLLFHAFIKKTDKTPEKELNKALRIAVILNKKYKLK